MHPASLARSRPLTIGRRLALVAIGASSAVGCRGLNWFERQPEPSSPPVLMPAAERSDAADPAMQEVFVEFEVLRIEVDQGALSKSGTLWDFTEPGGVAARTGAAMRFNGFRIGVGRPAAWELIQQAVDPIENATVKRDLARPTRAFPLEILLSDEEQPHTVFYVNEQGAMAGQSFQAARPVLTIAHSIRPDRLESVQLRLVPELREPPGPPSWKKVGDQYVELPEYRGRVYRELSFDVAVPRGGFLILGPTADAARHPLLGRSFFTNVVEGRRRESIYIIRPSVRRSG